MVLGRQTLAEGVNRRKVAVEVRVRHAMNGRESTANEVPQVAERGAEPGNVVLASNLYGQGAVDYQARHEAK